GPYAQEYAGWAFTEVDEGRRAVLRQADFRMPRGEERIVAEVHVAARPADRHGRRGPMAGSTGLRSQEDLGDPVQGLPRPGSAEQRRVVCRRPLDLDGAVVAEQPLAGDEEIARLERGGLAHLDVHAVRASLVAEHQALVDESDGRGVRSDVRILAQSDVRGRPAEAV